MYVIASFNFLMQDREIFEDNYIGKVTEWKSKYFNVLYQAVEHAFESE